MKVSLAVITILFTLMALGACGGGTSSVTPPLQLSFTTTPPVTAREGQLYTYVIAVRGPGQSTATYRLVSGPTGALISGNTLTWTPSPDQARTSNSFAISAAAGASIVNQNWSLTPAGTVRGTRIVSYITDSGISQRPDDTTQLTIAALAPNGRGGFTSIPGAGSTDGTYSIANVPGGYYWLQNGAQTYVWTNRSAIDTGHDTLGMPDRAYPVMPTSFDFVLTELNPWQDGDEQQAYVPNTNTWLDFAWGIQDGATSVFQQVAWTDPLLNAEQGDEIYLTQLVTTPTASGASVQVLAKATEPVDDITQPDGTEIELDAEMESVTLAHFIRGNISGSAFAQLESGANPSAIPDSSYLYFDGHPGGTIHGWIGNTPDLVAFDGTDTPIRTDVDMGDIAYGDPYPETWGKFLDYVHYVRMDYTAAGAANSTTQYAYFEVQTTDLPTVISPVSPIVGSVENPTINGTSFFSNVGGIGTMPTLSWNPPALGAPTGYEVEVYHLYGDGTESFTELAGDLYTTTTSIQLPPGLLTAGNCYYFRLSAIYEPGVDFATSPFRHSFPRGVAQSLSGVVVP